MQGRFKMEYRLFTIVRYNYNYRDYNRLKNLEPKNFPVHYPYRNLMYSNSNNQKSVFYLS